MCSLFKTNVLLYSAITTGSKNRINFCLSEKESEDCYMGESESWKSPESPKDEVRVEMNL